MAYCDYGALVYQNGQERFDKEDCLLFENGALDLPYHVDYSHGVMGDGNIRVRCYKQGLPQILELQDDEVVKIPYAADDVDRFEYGTIDFEYKGYTFHFEDGEPYYAQMIEPDGTKWECSYDYGYGHGFDEE